MDFQRVPNPMSKIKCKSKRKNEPIKVVYISSPMKVKTSASRFRAIVQELTGRYSDVATLMMDAKNSTKFEEFEEIPEEFCKGSSSLLPSALKHEENSPSNESAITAMSSEDLSKHLVDVFSTTHHTIEEEFTFPPEFVYESDLMDFLGSYNDVSRI